MAFARPGYILCCGARACRRLSTDEVEGAAGFFVNRGPVLGGSAGGWGFGIGGMRGWRGRSQFGGSGGVEVVPEVAFGLTAATAQFGVGAVSVDLRGGNCPAAPVRADLSAAAPVRLRIPPISRASTPGAASRFSA